MKLNEIDFQKFTNQELVALCLKYKLIERCRFQNVQEIVYFYS